MAIGIGVNLINHPSKSSFKATSLKEEFNFNVDRDEFLNKLNINLLAKINIWKMGENFSQILNDWKRFAYKINENISMLLPTGEKVDGKFSDLNDQGGLILSYKENSVFYAAEIIEELKLSKNYFLPLGGTGEIGMNLNLYGYSQENNEEWIMIDCGVTFSQSGTPGIDLQMADPSFIAKKRKIYLELY